MLLLASVFGNSTCVFLLHCLPFSTLPTSVLSSALFWKDLFEVVPFPDLPAPPLRCSPGLCGPLVYVTAPWASSTFLFTSLQLASGLVSVSGFCFCVSPSLLGSTAFCFYLYLCLVPLCSVVSQSSKSSTSLVQCSLPVSPLPGSFIGPFCLASLFQTQFGHGLC